MPTMSTTTLPSGPTIQWSLHNDKPGLPTLVLLNGSIFNMGQWKRIVNAGIGAGRFRLLRYDYAGTGGSTDRAGGTTMKALGSELVELLDALELDTVHLYGQSQGTMVAQALAATAPERVASTAGWGWFYGSCSQLETTRAVIVERVAGFKSLNDIWDEPLSKPHFDRLFDAVYRQALFGQTWQEMNPLARGKDWVIRRMLFPLITPTPVRTMHDWFDYCVQGLTEEVEWLNEGARALGERPLLIQHAEDDQTLHIAMARELNALVPNSTLMEYGQGYTHISAAFKPAHSRKVVADYHDFLKQQGL